MRRRRAGPSIRDIAASGQILETEEAQRTAQRLARIVESHGDAILSVDLRRRVRSWNPAAQRLFGYREKEIMGCPVTRLAPPELRRELLAAVKRAERRGRAELETRRLRQDGTAVHVSVGVAPLRDPRGRLIGFSATLRDVSARRRVEEALKESEEKFRRLVENLQADHFFYRHGTDGVFSYLSPSIRSVLGYTQGEFLTHYSAYLTENPVNQEVVAHTDRSIRGEQQPPYLVEIFHKDGSRHWLRVLETPVFGEAGRVVAVEGMAQDITDQLRADAALRESEERYRVLLESSPLAISVLREGRIVLVNRAFLCLYGFRCAEQVVGRTPYFLVAKGCVAAMREQHRRRLAGGVVPSSFETAGRRKDGSTFPVAMQVGSILLPEGPAALCHFTDITARKRGEKELQSMHSRIVAAQETERRRLSRDLHDGVGQILSGAKYSLHSLAAGLAAVAPRGARRALKLADLLDRAVAEVRRVSWNLIPPELESMGLAAAVRTHCQEFSARWGIAVAVDCGALPQKCGPEMSLALFRITQEALANIAAHARATRAAVRLRRKGGQIVLSIVDNGTGFAAKRRAHRKGRSGAGLANIQERAESFGGALALFSAPKQGTQLVVRMPLTKL